jgi:undecaprenyl-diphosphatase
MSISTSPTKNSRERLREYWLLIRGRVELRLLIGILLIGMGLWLFVELADEVIEGDTISIDEAILLALRNPADPTDPLGPPWLEELGRDYTALGGVGVVGLVTGVICLYMALARRWDTIMLIVIVFAGSILLNQLLKSTFDRPRPDLVPHGMVVYFASFPSGHAMLSASIYLTLGALLARMQQKRFQIILIMGTAIFVTVLVGISRVYLAVHWPSDVLAGWTAGSIWATVCWLTGWKLRQYRRPNHSVAAAENTEKTLTQTEQQEEKA